MDNEQLARHTVKCNSGDMYKALQMTQEQISARRSYIRSTLRNFPEWCNQTNENIDRMTLQRMDNGFLLEDSRGCPFYIAAGGITATESSFRRSRSMMPFQFIDLMGKDFDWMKYRSDITKPRKTVNDYVLNYELFKANGMGLYIYSRTKGSGKTMLACCILNELSNRYYGSVKFINILDLLEKTKKNYNGGGENIDQLYDASILVLDDIGVQMSKEWVDTVLYRLINSRYERRLPIIYTSNVSIDELRIDDRITDRIESTTYCVPLPDESIRKMERQKVKEDLLKQIK